MKRVRRQKKVQLGLALLGLIVIGTALASGLRLDPLGQNPEAILRPPSAEHLLGTDTLGRDLLARVLHGAKISLAVSVGAVIATIMIGLPLGAIAGYVGGVTDSVIMRVADILLAFPFVLGAIALVTIIGPGPINILVALVVFGWPQIARLARASVIEEAAKDYIGAVRVVGGSGWYVLRRHLLPNAAGPIAVFGLMGVSTAILTEATLSFLGLGVQLPDPSWGAMLAEAVGRITSYAWLIIGPGLALVATCLSFNLIGEGVRDAFEIDAQP